MHRFVSLAGVVGLVLLGCSSSESGGSPGGGGGGDGGATASSSSSSSGGSSSSGSDGGGGSASASSGGGEACSGNGECDDGAFCDWGLCGDGECGACGTPGTCRAKPASCDGETAALICACDGTVYANACEANLAGARAMTSTGGCPAPAGTFSCAEHYCAVGGEVCVELSNADGSVDDGCEPSPDGCAADDCDCLLASLTASDACTACETHDGGARVSCPGYGF